MQFNRDHLNRKRFRPLNAQEEKQCDKKLAEYSRLSLDQFKVYKSADLKTLRGKAPGAIPTHILLGIEDSRIWQFRITRKIRALGLLDGDVFLILWIDPTHKFT